MSFRLFIYFCALCGGGGAFVGWALGRMAAPATGTLAQGIKGLFLGLIVALALGLVDALAVVSVRRAGAVAYRVLTAVGVGTLGGLLGGLVGQMFYEAADLGFFFILGWTLTGFLIGVSLSVFDLLSGVMRGQDPSGALRKLRNGALGGTAGGLLGGILAMALHAIFEQIFAAKSPEQLWSPTSWGFVALGMCIGLFIGVAQVVLKDAWIKVEKGFRPGRELLLTRPETSVGRAETCDLGLFGDPEIERLHALIRREGNGFVLRDAGTPGGTYVNGELVTGPQLLYSGDRIRLGRAILRFGERAKKR
jgi:hypothetical protein